MGMVWSTVADVGSSTLKSCGPLLEPLSTTTTDPLNPTASKGKVPTLTCVPAGLIFHPVGNVTVAGAAAARDACWAAFAYATASEYGVCFTDSHISRLKRS